MTLLITDVYKNVLVITIYISLFIVPISSLLSLTEVEVTINDEMASFLLQLSTWTTTRKTESCKSHAIFTISMERRNIAGDEILCAKFHFVDLTDSEEVKINKVVLNELPFRDSKLPRILQNSLGGNGKTAMIACVNPEKTNSKETLNTLKYSYEARRIQNRLIVNQKRVRNQTERLCADFISSKLFEELKVLIEHELEVTEKDSWSQVLYLSDAKVILNCFSKMTSSSRLEIRGLKIENVLIEDGIKEIKNIIVQKQTFKDEEDKDEDKKSFCKLVKRCSCQRANHLCSSACSCADYKCATRSVPLTDFTYQIMTRRPSSLLAGTVNRTVK